MSPIESFDHYHAITLGGTSPGVSRRVLKLGEVIGGSYRLKSLLGKGGMGYVFCAEHTTIKRDYALKMLAPEHLNEESRRRFEIEGRAIAKLDHQNIIKVYDMGLDAGDCPFYVMDLLHGIALSECIDRKQDIAFEECLNIFRQIASGLGYAHSKGIVHRDVKPSNIILLTDSSGRRRVKIVDFGIAKLLPSAALSSQSLTATGAIFGSPLYMSPEQCMGSAVDHRSDIYSLGCTLFETLSGKPPFYGQNAMETVMMHQNEPVPSILQTEAGKHLPQSVDLLLRKMLAKRPENRYQSMEQLKHDLGRMMQGKAIGSVVEARRAVAASQPDQAPAFPPDHAPASADPAAVQAGGLKDGDHRGKQRPFRLILGMFVSLTVIGGVAIWAWYAHPGFHQSGRSDQTGQTGQTATGVQNHPPGHSGSGQGQKSLSKKVGPQDDSFVDQFLGKGLNLGESIEHPGLDQKMATDKFGQCQGIKSTIVISQGFKHKRFVFPDWPVGNITAVGFGPVDAVGVKIVPADRPLTLAVGLDKSREVLNNPAIMDKIDPSEFSGLSITGRIINRFGSKIVGIPPETNGLLHILKTASRWPKLDMVMLSSLPLNRETLNLINNCKHLSHLVIRNPTVDTVDLASQSFLCAIPTLVLDNIDKIDPIFDKLSGSKNLQEIQFSRCHVTPDALLKLQACSQLHKLELQLWELQKQDLPSDVELDPLVRAIAKLTTLQEVRFVDTVLKPEQIRMITACPNIRRLILIEPTLSPQEVQRCAYHEPKVTYEEYK